MRGRDGGGDLCAALSGIPPDRHTADFCKRFCVPHRGGSAIHWSSGVHVWEKPQQRPSDDAVCRDDRDRTRNVCRLHRHRRTDLAHA